MAVETPPLIIVLPVFLLYIPSSFLLVSSTSPFLLTVSSFLQTLTSFSFRFSYSVLVSLPILSHSFFPLSSNNPSFSQWLNIALPFLSFLTPSSLPHTLWTSPSLSLLFDLFHPSFHIVILFSSFRPLIFFLLFLLTTSTVHHPFSVLSSGKSYLTLPFIHLISFHFSLCIHSPLIFFHPSRFPASLFRLSPLFSSSVVGLLSSFSSFATHSLTSQRPLPLYWSRLLTGILPCQSYSFSCTVSHTLRT